jgi:hypothetical protein
MPNKKLTVDLRKKSLSERVEFLKDLLAVRVHLHRKGVNIKMKRKCNERAEENRVCEVDDWLFAEDDVS